MLAHAHVRLTGNRKGVASPPGFCALFASTTRPFGSGDFVPIRVEQSELLTPRNNIQLPAIPPTTLAYAPSVTVETLADRLIQFRIDGVKLRNERIAPEGFTEWKARVDQWKA